MSDITRNQIISLIEDQGPQSATAISSALAGTNKQVSPRVKALLADMLDDKSLRREGFVYHIVTEDDDVEESVSDETFVEEDSDYNSLYNTNIENDNNTYVWEEGYEEECVEEEEDDDDDMSAENGDFSKNSVPPTVDFGYVVERTANGYHIETPDHKSVDISENERIVVINQDPKYRYRIKSVTELLTILCSKVHDYAASKGYFSFVVRDIYQQKNISSATVTEISTEPVIIFLEVRQENKAAAFDYNVPNDFELVDLVQF